MDREERPRNQDGRDGDIGVLPVSALHAVLMNQVGSISGPTFFIYPHLFFAIPHIMAHEEKWVTTSESGNNVGSFISITIQDASVL